jgi:glyoxylase-like metal-dependent hydrolase (beta-lactamase superfamily II)
MNPRARVERLVIPGQYRLGDTVRDVENNVWIVGDGVECVVIDASHDEDLIAAEVGARMVLAILCTHGHNDHVNAAPALAHYTGAPVLLHEADRVLWDGTHPGVVPDGALAARYAVAGIELHVIGTPGHTAGGVSFYSPELAAVFTGDTLLAGRPGETGQVHSDAAELGASIREKLFVLPSDTAVLPGHGQPTTIGVEQAHSASWFAAQGP